jgi:outer membrane protein OmpA-like peptidoglycan-associated protein
MLDDLATKALAMKGYVIEVAGFADSMSLTYDLSGRINR